MENSIVSGEVLDFTLPFTDVNFSGMLGGVFVSLVLGEIILPLRKSRNRKAAGDISGAFAKPHVVLAARLVALLLLGFTLDQMWSNGASLIYNLVPFTIAAFVISRGIATGEQPRQMAANALYIVAATIIMFFCQLYV